MSRAVKWEVCGDRPVNEVYSGGGGWVLIQITDMLTLIFVTTARLFVSMHHVVGMGTPAVEIIVGMCMGADLQP